MSLPLRRISHSALTLAPAAVVLALEVALGLQLAASTGWTAWETGVVTAVHAGRSVGADAAAVAINVLFGPTGSVLVAIGAVVAVVSITRSRRIGVAFALVVLVPWVIAETMKSIVRRARPDPGIVGHLLIPEPRSFSYPSGHTAFAAAICTAIALAVIARRARVAAISIGALVVVSTAWSRVYLGVHFPSDVITSVVVVTVTAVALSPLTGLAPPRRDAHSSGYPLKDSFLERSQRRLG